MKVNFAKKTYTDFDKINIGDAFFSAITETYYIKISNTEGYGIMDQDKRQFFSDDRVRLVSAYLTLDD